MRKQAIIDQHQEDWEYPCKAEHRDYDGIHTFPTDMLHWYQDGFYCEYCLLSLVPFGRGRSLEKEIELARERGKCYRSLPHPLYFGEDDDAQDTL